MWSKAAKIVSYNQKRGCDEKVIGEKMAVEVTGKKRSISAAKPSVLFILALVACAAMIVSPLSFFADAAVAAEMAQGSVAAAPVSGSSMESSPSSSMSSQPSSSSSSSSQPSSSSMSSSFSQMSESHSSKIPSKTSASIDVYQYSEEKFHELDMINPFPVIPGTYKHDAAAYKEILIRLFLRNFGDRDVDGRAILKHFATGLKLPSQYQARPQYFVIGIIQQLVTGLIVPEVKPKVYCTGLDIPDDYADQPDLLSVGLVGAGQHDCGMYIPPGCGVDLDEYYEHLVGFLAGRISIPASFRRNRNAYVKSLLKAFALKLPLPSGYLYRSEFYVVGLIQKFAMAAVVEKEYYGRSQEWFRDFNFPSDVTSWENHRDFFLNIHIHNEDEEHDNWKCLKNPGSCSPIKPLCPPGEYGCDPNTWGPDDPRPCPPGELGCDPNTWGPDDPTKPTGFDPSELIPFPLPWNFVPPHASNGGCPYVFRESLIKQYDYMSEVSFDCMSLWSRVLDQNLEISRMSDRLVHQHIEMHSQTERIEQFQTENTKLHLQLEAKEAEIRMLKERITGMSTQHESREFEYSRVKQELEFKKTEIKERETRIEEMHTEIIVYKRQSESKDIIIKNYEERIQHFEARITDLSVQISKHHAELHLCHSSAYYLEQSMQCKSEDHRMLIERIISLEKILIMKDKEIDNYKLKIYSLNIEITNLDNSIVHITNMYDQCQIDVKHCNDRVFKLEIDIDTCNGHRDTCHSTIIELRDQIVVFENKITIITRERDYCYSERDHCHKSIEEYEVCEAMFNIKIEWTSDHIKKFNSLILHRMKHLHLDIKKEILMMFINSQDDIAVAINNNRFDLIMKQIILFINGGGGSSLDCKWRETHYETILIEYKETIVQYSKIILDLKLQLDAVHKWQQGCHMHNESNISIEMMIKLINELKIVINRDCGGDSHDSLIVLIDKMFDWCHGEKSHRDKFSLDFRGIWKKITDITVNIDVHVDGGHEHVVCRPKPDVCHYTDVDINLQWCHQKFGDKILVIDYQMQILALKMKIKSMEMHIHRWKANPCGGGGTFTLFALKSHIDLLLQIIGGFHDHPSYNELVTIHADILGWWSGKHIDHKELDISIEKDIDVEIDIEVESYSRQQCMDEYGYYRQLYEAEYKVSRARMTQLDAQLQISYARRGEIAIYRAAIAKLERRAQSGGIIKLREIKKIRVSLEKKTQYSSAMEAKSMSKLYKRGFFRSIFGSKEF